MALLCSPSWKQGEPENSVVSPTHCLPPKQVQRSFMKLKGRRVCYPPGAEWKPSHRQASLVTKLHQTTGPADQTSLTPASQHGIRRAGNRTPEGGAATRVGPIVFSLVRGFPTRRPRPPEAIGVPSPQTLIQTSPAMWSRDSYLSKRGSRHMCQGPSGWSRFTARARAGDTHWAVRSVGHLL